MMPRERALKYGIETLSDIELLSLILRTGNKKQDVLYLAKNIINDLKSLSNLSNQSIESLQEYDGIGEIRALELMAVVQVALRLNDIAINDYIYLNNPEIIFEMFKLKFSKIDQEHFMVLSLNAKNALIAHDTLFIGTLSYSIVHPREVFKCIVGHSACSFIMVHNHPSGNPQPSEDDYEITKKLYDLSLTMGIPLLDHIIIGKERYYSFKENNII